VTEYFLRFYVKNKINIIILNCEMDIFDLKMSK